MDQIIVFRGDQLEGLKAYLAKLTGDDVYVIRACVDEGGLKFKANEFVWTPAMGDEESE